MYGLRNGLNFHARPYLMFHRNILKKLASKNYFTNKKTSQHITSPSNFLYIVQQIKAILVIKLFFRHFHLICSFFIVFQEIFMTCFQLNFKKNTTVVLRSNQIYKTQKPQKSQFQYRYCFNKICKNKSENYGLNSLNKSRCGACKSALESFILNSRAYIQFT